MNLEELLQWSLKEPEEELQQALKELGKTEQEVAETLKRSGCNGNAKDPRNCPVAQWLKKKGIPSPSVGKKYVWEPLNTEMPKQVSAFITSFDCGKYPELA